MKSALDNMPPFEDAHSLRLRKQSFFQQASQQWEQSLEINDLKKLGYYINNNIQSQRKNIMQLYSNSFYTLQKNQHLILPELCTPTTARKSFMKRSGCQGLSPIKITSNEDTANDRDFIVSNNFPNKIIKPIEKPKIELVKQSPPKKIIVPKIVCKQTKAERIVNQIQKVVIKKKLPKLLKSKNIENDPNGLNPWEYLKIQDEPIFNCL